MKRQRLACPLCVSSSVLTWFHPLLCQSCLSDLISHLPTVPASSQQPFSASSLDPEPPELSPLPGFHPLMCFKWRHEGPPALPPALFTHLLSPHTFALFSPLSPHSWVGWGVKDSKLGKNRSREEGSEGEHSPPLGVISPPASLDPVRSGEWDLFRLPEASLA